MDYSVPYHLVDIYILIHLLIYIYIHIYTQYTYIHM